MHDMALRSQGGLHADHSGAEVAFATGSPGVDFLRIGGLALGGLTMPQLLRAEASAGVGRSHKPVSFALLAGGGMRTGQVIGATDKLAAYPKDRPVWFQNVFATLYHNLGIDPATLVTDRGGRPMALLDEREPIRAVI